MGRIVFLVMCVAARAAAHDFWIEPSTFRPAVGQLFTASLLVGQNFVGEPIPRSTPLIDAFIVSDVSGQRPVNGFENHDPAGYIRLPQAGLAIIGYRSKPSQLELPAEKFNEFLLQEGLDRVRQVRMARGEMNRPDRERFFRYAKAIVGSGAGGFDQPLGYRLEIIPETDPLDFKPLRLRLLFEGKPLAGALVTAIDRNGRLSARSDASGHVTFALPKNGVWLIKSVHMIPAPPGTNADWESLWASLTFER